MKEKVESGISKESTRAEAVYPIARGLFFSGQFMG
jgi:hypothetical protein